MKALIDKLAHSTVLSREEYAALIRQHTPQDADYLFEKARAVRQQYYGRDIYIRGLIEFTNYCKNDCLYCGIRCSNRRVSRYRLSEQQILNCCRVGHRLGFRTFVLQGGEDPYFTQERMVSLIRHIKADFPDCALTLSVGEKCTAEYQAYYDAGADRYLLRHETADNDHYRRLHPPALSPQNRKHCLRELKRIGFQTGCGFMVGSPYQTAENLADDMLFIKELQPHMVGIGPFIPQHDTPFGTQKAGTLEQTLFMLGLLRLTLPQVLLPATTALGTIHPQGRERGILAGANVVMPNLSPADARKHYMLYDNKLSDGDEAAEGKMHLTQRMEAIGYHIVTDRGDHAACVHSHP